MFKLVGHCGRTEAQTFDPTTFNGDNPATGRGLGDGVRVECVLAGLDLGTTLNDRNTIDLCKWARKWNAESVGTGRIRCQYWKKGTERWTTLAEQPSPDKPQFTKDARKYRIHPEDMLATAHVFYGLTGDFTASNAAEAEAAGVANTTAPAAPAVRQWTVRLDDAASVANAYDVDPSQVYAGLGLGSGVVAYVIGEYNQTGASINLQDTKTLCKFADRMGYDVQYWRKRDMQWVTEEACTYTKESAKYRVHPDHMLRVAIEWYKSHEDVQPVPPVPCMAPTGDMPAAGSGRSSSAGVFVVHKAQQLEAVAEALYCLEEACSLANLTCNVTLSD